MDKKFYGWKPDQLDLRDQMYSFRMPIGKIKSVFLKDDYTMPDIFNQGEIGSCTANSIAYALAFDTLNKNNVIGKIAEPPYSRLFIYYNEREMEGTVSLDAGARIRDGIKSVASLGACTEKGWCYDVTKFTEKPPVEAYTEAVNYKALKYERLDNRNKRSLIDCLSSGHPFVFGFSVYEQFESPEAAETGTIQLPKAGEAPLGGHAVCCVGYDLATDRFTVVNSWGAEWGQQGHFTIPAIYLTNPMLAEDFWTITTIS